MDDKKLTYTEAGVNIDKEQEGIESILSWVKKTLTFSKMRTKLGYGHFANVIDIGMNRGIAISTDGVGTKIIVAEMMKRYDTIGIDCVAMNVNDVVCVGAMPFAMVDYIAVTSMEPKLLSGIGKGLHDGAKIANISIPGGEIAQLKEMLAGGEDSFDLVGTSIGIVDIDRIIDGKNIRDGDVLIGLKSSGIHSNGLTLARRALFDKGGFKIDTYIDEIGRTIGEELLEPTKIYSSTVVKIIEAGIDIKALYHITGGGLLNLRRLSVDYGFIIEHLPEPQPIFNLIQEVGGVDDEEMFRVFNMGIGFCIVLDRGDVKHTLNLCSREGLEGFELGYAVKDRDKKILIKEKSLIGFGDRFITQGV
ncbi:MAG: phosphoribosylformylglycinamidine cyclo-ligase [Nitrospirae bacterium]|nr:MAG: phosphoribosylformylglycinamidine cyclo-ligase [Nitrospirota bacterium]